MAKKAKRRFVGWENEGSFFYEPMVHDQLEDKHYPGHKVPPAVMVLLIDECISRGSMGNAHLARIVFDYARNAAQQKRR